MEQSTEGQSTERWKPLHQIHLETATKAVDGCLERAAKLKKEEKLAEACIEEIGAMVSIFDELSMNDFKIRGLGDPLIKKLPQDLQTMPAPRMSIIRGKQPPVITSESLPSASA